MTVTRINDPDGSSPEGTIAVAWFSEGDALCRDMFNPSSLVIRSGVIDAPRSTPASESTEEQKRANSAKLVRPTIGDLSR